MWNANKQERFSVLWEHQFNGALTQAEQTELESLINELDHLEGEMLQPGFARLDKEHKQLEAQNAMIESLLREREHLLQRAMSQIQQILQEHAQLKAKVASVRSQQQVEVPYGGTS